MIPGSIREVVYGYKANFFCKCYAVHLSKSKDMDFRIIHVNILLYCTAYIFKQKYHSTPTFQANNKLKPAIQVFIYGTTIWLSSSNQARPQDVLLNSLAPLEDHTNGFLHHCQKWKKSCRGSFSASRCCGFLSFIIFNSCFNSILSKHAAVKLHWWE